MDKQSHRVAIQELKHLRKTRDQGRHEISICWNRFEFINIKHIDGECQERTLSCNRILMTAADVDDEMDIDHWKSWSQTLIS